MSKSLHLSIYLVKRGWDAPRLFTKAPSLTKHTIGHGGRNLGDLWVKSSPTRPPDWLSLFAGSARPLITGLRCSGASAVWVLNTRGRKFALTFGYGRMSLNEEAVEGDFGLKVTLNCIDTERVRSVDRLTIDTISRHSQIQSSREAAISEFGLEVEQDLLRGVTGQPLDESLGMRMTGKDSLQVSVDCDLPRVPQILGRYLREYKKTTYRQRFPWVDYIREVRDATELSDLENALIQRLRSANYDKLWLTVPQLIEWGAIRGFKYGTAKRDPIHPDLHISDWMREKGNPVEAIDVGILRRSKVVGVSATDDQFIYHWPLYRCIYCEVGIKGKTYILNNGKWFRIADDFAQTVSQSFERIRTPGFELPEYIDNSEGEYNKRVADSDRRRFALMDKVLVRYPGAVDKIEFCDLYTNDRNIIHVKRYGGSSVLSHLFAQGLVSGEAFRRDEKFRRKLDQLLPRSHKLGRSVRSIEVSEYQIVFGVVSRSRKRLDLPFFSKVNLRNAERRLTDYGFRVALLKIPASTSRVLHCSRSLIRLEIEGVTVWGLPAMVEE